MATLDEIIRMATGLSEESRVHAEQVAAARSTQGQLGRQTAEMQREAAEMTEAVQLKQGLGELQAIQLARKGASAMGTNAADISEIITATAGQLRADLMAYQAAEAKVQEIEENSSLLGNPAGWLRDLLVGDEARATRDATLRRHQNTSAMMSNMFALTDANTRTQLSLAETSDADTIRKAAAANRTAAEVIANKSEIEALSFEVAGIDTLRTQGAEEFQRQSQIYNAIVQDERYKQSYEQTKTQLELQQRNLTRQERQDQSYEYVQENVKIALAAQGLEEIPLSVVQQFYGTNTPEGQMMMELSALGQMSRNIGSAVIAPSPAAAYNLLQRTGGRMPGNTDPVITDLMDTAAAKVQQELAQAAGFTTDVEVTPSGFTRKNIGDPATQMQVFDNIFKKDLEAEDTKFANRPINLGLVHKEYPQFLETAFGQTVIGPVLETAGRALTVSELGQLAAESYAAGELTSHEAADGLTLYTQAHYNLYNAMSGRTTIGLPRLIGEKYTTVPMPTGRTDLKATVMDMAAAGLGVGLGMPSALRMATRNAREEITPVDVTSHTDVIHYLNRYRTNAVARKMKEATTAGRAAEGQGEGN